MAKDKFYLERESSFLICQSYRIGPEDEFLGYSNEVAFASNRLVANTLRYDFTSKAVTPINALFLGYSTSDTYDELPFCDLSPPDTPPTPGTRHAARVDIHPTDYRSGVVNDLTPTAGDEMPTSMTQIFNRDQYDNIRGVGLKVPVIVTGWGYTTEGLPTPNLHDQKVLFEDEYAPTFEDAEANKRRFAENYKVRNDLMKSGPLDLRWDESRRMWRSTPEVYGGYALYNIPSASGRYAPSGVNFSSGEIEVLYYANEPAYTPNRDHKLLIHNRSITTDISSGTWIIAIRANNGEFWPIFVDCAPDRSGLYI